MVYKKYYLIIIFRVLLLAANALVLFYYWWLPGLLHLKFALAAIFLLQVIMLIWFLNRINRKLSSFFDSLRSDDYTMVFSDEKNKGEFSGLNEQLDKLTKYFRQLKIENEQKNLYFKAVIEHVPTGIFAFEKSGKIKFINSSALEFFGLSFVKNIRSLETIQADLPQFFKKLKPGTQQLLEIKSDNEVLQLSARSTIYKTNEEHLILVSLQNIRSELEQKETQTWQKLIRILTHEIMNSISPITSLASSLSKVVLRNPNAEVQLDDKKIAKLDKGLSTIKRRGEGLVEFVGKYRELTILPEPRVEEIKLADLFNSLSLLFEKDLQDGEINFSFKVEPDSLVLIADAKMIEQVLINLLKNAIWAVSEVENREIEIKAFPTKENGLKILVNDTGKGIDKQDLDKIFIPFYTTREGGSGIGLSLSRQLLIINGGSISVHLDSAGKTQFVLQFVN